MDERINAVILSSIALECDSPILEAIYNTWPPRPMELLYWLHRSLFALKWLPLPSQRQDIWRHPATPLKEITFAVRYERDGRAILITAEFQEKAELWVLTVANITSTQIVHATWRLNDRRWHLGYIDHAEFGFKTLVGLMLN
jgi:hypothetical protein